MQNVEYFSSIEYLARALNMEFYVCGVWPGLSQVAFPLSHKVKIEGRLCMLDKALVGR